MRLVGQRISQHQVTGRHEPITGLHEPRHRYRTTLSYPQSQGGKPGMLNVAKQVYLTVKGRPTPTPPATARTVQGHTDVVSAVAFFKDGRRVVTGSWDCTLQIWDMHKGVSIGKAFLGHKDTVRSVAISPDDRRIASGGVDNTIIIWNVESKQKVFDPLVKHTRTVWSVCFSPDGKRLASGSNDSTVVVWDAETGAVISTLEGHSDFVLSVAFSPDGLKLASGSDDHTIRVWRIDNAELLLEINAHEDRVRSVVWSHDGQQLVSSSYDKEVKFWDVFNGDQISHPCTGHTHHIYSLAISSDGSFIATASDDNTVRLWSTKTHRQIGQALQHTAGVRCIAISPNGELLVSGDEKGKIRSQSIKDILEQGKVEEWLTEVDETHRQQLLSRSNTCAVTTTTTSPPVITTSQAVISRKIMKSLDRFSLISFGILAMNTTVRNACITGDLNAAEFLLTQEIDANGANCDSYANRSIVRARNSEWDNALQDAIKSIAIQPSLLGYVCKGIALCGNEQLWDAMEAFDLAFIFSNRDPTTIDLLLLIKAVALFNASRHDEAMRRVRDLSTAFQHSNTLLCSVVSSYLCVQLAIIAFEDGRYNEVPITPCKPKCKIFTVLFGWDLDSLWSIANQRRCNACLCAGRVIEAVESHHYMTNTINKDPKNPKDSYLKWSTGNLQEKLHCVLSRKGG
ncbi:WD40-repeat-containing domain protein [Suillus clintonianus]|uniref:WD40-repeat-containing domain protein n=1 Tax=Suillus clintonianus TaxID=1904413 RepID=UPI001B884285|nr:WD40-repeat-containing domain protein [Suillus clintonianus]KAG2150427.1 WD40-repeat-containing domain protein [Suillus clintonianus]